MSVRQLFMKFPLGVVVIRKLFAAFEMLTVRMTEPEPKTSVENGNNYIRSASVEPLAIDNDLALNLFFLICF